MKTTADNLRCNHCKLPLQYPYTTVHSNLFSSFDYHNDCLRKSIVETAEKRDEALRTQ